MNNKNSNNKLREKIITILNHFDIPEPVRILPYSKGRVNETFLIETDSTKKLILQKLNRIFKPELLIDIEVITSHLEGQGIITPRLIMTKSGRRGFVQDGSIWRLLTYIPGGTIEKGITEEQARSGGKIIGEFHNSLCEFNYSFEYEIPDFHDTNAIVLNLKTVMRSHKNSDKFQILKPLANRLLNEYEGLEKLPDNLPQRIIHGDLKLNNVIFDETGTEAICLIDLDTIGKGTIPIDLGDAFRSWCQNETDNSFKFNVDIFIAMLEGYLANSPFIGKREIEQIPSGISIIILELAARYIIDAFEESYFTLDENKYESTFEQNSDKARLLLGLFDDFKGKRMAVEETIKKHL